MIHAADIAAWLPQARWFAGKGRGSDVAVHDAADIPGTAVTLALVDVAAGSTAGAHRYVVPLAAGADAAAAPEFARWLVHTVLGGGALAGRHGAFRGHPAGATAGLPAADAAATVAPLGGDASNTSLLVALAGRRFAVKLLRRCRAGIQPEVEVGEFLAAAGWEGTPPLRGWLEYAPASGGSMALATVHDFAADAESAWEHLLGLVSAGGLAGANRARILDVVTLLGRTTAGLHRALGSRSDVAAFAPERPTDGERRGRARDMQAHAMQVFDLAAGRLPTLPATVAAGVRTLLDHRHAILAALGRLDTIGTEAALIRVHGDYHLGQVLVDAGRRRALVIDFEGEPGRSLDDRRRKTSVLKDVAGMCRSFDYLLRHAARCGTGVYRADDLRLLECGFLEAYRASAQGQVWWPADAAAADALLAVYRLDKAVYELAYELTNRPDWVDVPLAALTDTMGG